MPTPNETAMKHRIEHIIFDLDGTLIDAEDGIYECMNYAFEQMGYNLERKTITDSIGLSLSTAYKELCGDSCPNNAKQFIAHFNDSIPGRLTTQTKLLAHTPELLKTLKQLGFQVSLVTSKNRFELDEVIEKFSEDLDFFHTIAGNEVNELNKPHPYPIEKAVKELNTKLQNSLYIGDSWVDAEASFKAGTKFIAVLTGNGKREDFLTYAPLAILPTLDYLPGLMSYLTIEHEIYNTIMQLGGFWPIEFTCLRMTEELGELAEAIMTANIKAIAEEMADLLFICCCIVLKEDISCLDGYLDYALTSNNGTKIINNDISKNFLQLSSEVGELSRLINYLHGPKKLKAGKKIEEDLGKATSSICRLLLEVAAAYDINLLNTLEEKIATIKVRDKTRFTSISA